MEGATDSPQQRQQQQQQQQRSTGQLNSLEDDMSNLRLSNNQNANVDLYGGEGRMPMRSHYQQPNTLQNNTTSTSKEQLLSDEEFARRLVREDDGLDTPIASAAPAKAVCAFRMAAAEALLTTISPF